MPDSTPVSEVTVDELAERLAAGGVVVDVRQPDEYVEGHVPSAVLIPLAEVPDRLAEIPVASPLHVVCRTGGRSLRAAQFLAAQGREVVNVAGGTLAWIDSGRAVVTGDQPG